MLRMVFSIILKTAKKYQLNCPITNGKLSPHSINIITQHSLELLLVDIRLAHNTGISYRCTPKADMYTG